MSRDPLGERAGVNLYAYVGSNSVRFRDPLGLETLGLGWGASAAIGPPVPAVPAAGFAATASGTSTISWNAPNLGALDADFVTSTGAGQAIASGATVGGGITGFYSNANSGSDLYGVFNTTAVSLSIPFTLFAVEVKHEFGHLHHRRYNRARTGSRFL